MKKRQKPVSATERGRRSAQPPAVAAVAPELDQARRTSMAVERTWLAGWRTALAASAGSLAVGRLAPELLDVAGVALRAPRLRLRLAGDRAAGSWAHCASASSSAPCEPAITYRCPVRTVGVFTAGGVALAVMTVVLVIAQT